VDLGNETTHVGFIGLGIMGQSMAGHILKAGYQLNVFNRSRDKAAALVAQGARWCDTPSEVAGLSDAVITMVGYPHDVEAIYFGPDGIIANAKAGAMLIDMTTSSPALAERIAAAANERGLHALDAPVSGGDIGAREARLSIMTGGSRRAFDCALPLLKIMGKNIVLQGGPGAGQHTKMCNQIVVASTIMSVCEGLAYASAAGLNAETVLESIGSGAATSFQLNVLGQRITQGDFAPGFMIEHFIKDMGIAIGEAERMKLELPGLALAKKLFQQLADNGFARLGTHALFKYYRP
jgi:3-hydroxyisobutyrate dehydrogenase